MATWAALLEQAGELGTIASDRLLGPGLALLGTIRRDGTPRISPIEIRTEDGELQLGMMWRSPKALDLLHDPRCVLHSLVSDKDGSEGDVKVTGRGVEVTDPARLELYCCKLYEETGWRPESEFHLFVLDVVEAGYVQFIEGRETVRAWRPGAPPRLWEKAAH